MYYKGCDSTMFDCESCTNDVCSYSVRYMDQSGFTALLYMDQITIGNETVTATVGGISTAVAGLYGFEPYEVDGIIVCLIFILFILNNNLLMILPPPCRVLHILISARLVHLH